jgi:hypothetical protein
LAPPERLVEIPAVHLPEHASPLIAGFLEVLRATAPEAPRTGRQG